MEIFLSLLNLLTLAVLVSPTDTKNNHKTYTTFFLYNLSCQTAKRQRISSKSGHFNLNTSLPRRLLGLFHLTFQERNLPSHIQFISTEPLPLPLPCALLLRTSFSIAAGLPQSLPWSPSSHQSQSAQDQILSVLAKPPHLLLLPHRSMITSEARASGTLAPDTSSLTSLSPSESSNTSHAHL